MLARVSNYWSCPMHARVRAGAPGNCPECGMALVGAGRSSPGRAYPGSVLSWACIALVTAVAAVWIYRDHLHHVPSALPYALFLLCPLIHLLGHRRGHSSH